jgi:hypothetical protein
VRRRSRRRRVTGSARLASCAHTLEACGIVSLSPWVSDSLGELPRGDTLVRGPRRFESGDYSPPVESGDYSPHPSDANPRDPEINQRGLRLRLRQTRAARGLRAGSRERYPGRTARARTRQTGRGRSARENSRARVVGILTLRSFRPSRPRDRAGVDGSVTGCESRHGAGVHALDGAPENRGISPGPYWCVLRRHRSARDSGFDRVRS